MFVRTKECLKTFEKFRKGRGKIVFGHNCLERAKQTNNAQKFLPYIGNLDSGEPYFSSKATFTSLVVFVGNILSCCSSCQFGFESFRIIPSVSNCYENLALVCGRCDHCQLELVASGSDWS